MTSRTYGQFCGLAHAMELIGERWALLVIRDLLSGPKRFTDLRNGLPRIPTNILSARLKELEGSGVIQRRLLPRPQGSVVYELTDYGRELEDVVLRLGLWGARTLGQPRPDDVVTTDSLRSGAAGPAGRRDRPERGGRRRQRPAQRRPQAAGAVPGGFPRPAPAVGHLRLRLIRSTLEVRNPPGGSGASTSSGD